MNLRRARIAFTISDPTVDQHGSYFKDREVIPRGVVGSFHRGLRTDVLHWTPMEEPFDVRPCKNAMAPAGPALCRITLLSDDASTRREGQPKRPPDQADLRPPRDQEPTRPRGLQEKHRYKGALDKAD